MKSRLLALLLASTLAQTISPVTLAQTNNAAQSAANTTAQDWQGMRDLKSGKKIRVEFKSGSTIDGKVLSIVGTTLTMSEGKSYYVLEQRDIQRIYSLKGGWSRNKALRVGSIIGLVVGSFVGGRAMDRLERNPNRIPSDADEIPLIAGMGIGTFVGAGLGYLLGGKRRGKILYEAK